MQNKEKMGQEITIVYQIMSILAKHKLSIKQSKEILEKTKDELENLVPWNQSSINVNSQE